MNRLILHTENLSIGFKSRGRIAKRLHSGINLRLFEGEITCLLGPNGSGKTTLLRTFSGFLPPLAGSVFIQEKNVNAFTSASLSRLASIVLTEKVELGSFPVFSVVALGRSPYTGFLGKLSANDRQIIEKALVSAGILHLSDQNFDELSDGEKQKVMIAKSLAQETPLILLDEPTAFLDFPSKAETLQLLRHAAWKEGKTVLLSTHDLNLALSFADKIWLMAKDKPIITGTPEDLILGGFFADFFNKGNTRFDSTNGTFTFESQKREEVAVTGSGQAYDWLVKALIRKGYQVSDQKNELPKKRRVDVFNTGGLSYELEINGKISKMGKIADVLDALEQSF